MGNFEGIFPKLFVRFWHKRENMAKKPKFITITLTFVSKRGFSKVNIYKIAGKTYPQNTMISNPLKSLKNALDVFEGVLFSLE